MHQLQRIALFASLILSALASDAPAQAMAPRHFNPRATYQVGFSPGDSAESLVVGLIGSARKMILCAAYDFTSRPIARALEAAARRGVSVYIVADPKEAHTRYSDIAALAQSGIAVRLDERYTTFHHKFIVVDGSSVETGSFNYTYSAWKRNAENVIVLRNVPYVAAVYADEWDWLWKQSQAVQ